MKISVVSVGPLIVGLLLCTTRDAAAYVDPGSSSYLFQILIAGLTATAFFFSTIKRKVGQAVRAVFGSKRNRANDHAVTEAPADSKF